MKFAKIYALSLIAIGVLSFLCSAVIPNPYSNYFGIAIAIVAVVWNIIGLVKFQRANLPLDLPMLWPLAMGTIFQITLFTGLSTPAVAAVFYGAGLVIIAAAYVTSIVMTIALFIRPEKMRQGEIASDNQSKAYAGFMRRLGAALVDGVILGICGFVLSLLFLLVFAGIAMINSHMDQDKIVHWISRTFLLMTLPGLGMGAFAPIAAFQHLLTSIVFTPKAVAMSSNLWIGISVGAQGLVINMLGLIYFAYTESSQHQATLGKQMFGLQVVDQKGERLTFLRALLRNIFKFVSFGTLCIGYLYIGFSPTKQGLHDLLSKCQVLRKHKARA